MNYKKRQKAKRRGRLGTIWRLNKLFEERKKQDFLKEEEVRKPRSKKKYECKRLRGEHDFVKIEEKDSSFLKCPFIISKCSACEKLKYEWEK